MPVLCLRCQLASEFSKITRISSGVWERSRLRTIEKSFRIRLVIGSGFFRSSFRMWTRSIKRPGATSMNPTRSCPRRPALPVIWWNSVPVRGEKSRPLKRSEFISTMVRAGKFTPAATVEVAKMARSRPCFINVSTRNFQAGSCPPWWAATHAVRSWYRCRWLCRKGNRSRRASISCVARPLFSSTWRHRESAASHSERDFRKKMAGSRRCVSRTSSISPNGGIP